MLWRGRTPLMAMAMAHRVGLDELVVRHVVPGGPCGVNAHLKVGCLVAGMAAGADSIDDMDLLRHGAMDALAATISTPLGAPVIAATRLRGGNANSARGAASFAAEAVGAARQTGCSGTVIVRAARTGIEFDPHWFRHSAVTRWLRDGVPIEVVSTLPGHSSVTVTSSVYGHLTAEDARAALEKAGWLAGREVLW